MENREYIKKSNKGGKRRLNERENPIIFPILRELAKKDDNSNGLSVRLNKNQAGIYNHLKQMEKEDKKYILPSKYKKNSYKINSQKLIEEYLNYSNKCFFEGEEEYEFLFSLIKESRFNTLEEIFETLNNYYYYKNIVEKN